MIFKKNVQLKFSSKNYCLWASFALILYYYSLNYLGIFNFREFLDKVLLSNKGSFKFFISIKDSNLFKEISIYIDEIYSND